MTFDATRRARRHAQRLQRASAYAEDGLLLGNTTGTTACAGGSRATAPACASTGRGVAAAAPQSAFPWKRTGTLANRTLGVAWAVRCTVNG
ncbi:MAG TPA: hypothetical protein VNA20_17950 [Frankiaceae bacterium]|nr:hypothetical protein [Frankiaceae bacterium]